MGFVMKDKVLAGAVALLLSAQPILSGPLTEVDLAPISHVEATLVVVGANGSERAYTPADLEALPTYSLTTSTPWRDEPAEFEGVLLADLLAVNGLNTVESIAVTAENDYKTVIERPLWETVDILVATRVDGRAHSRRARGPIQFVIDMSTFNASDLTSESNLVWMAARIEPNG